jgi:carbonic anhydrase/acetyltransferase-like protein (isoleucine patch superfamily)
VLDNATVEETALVAAGAVIKEGFTVPAGTLAAGVPAKIIRDLRPDEIERVTTTAANYVGYVKDYRSQLG